MTTCVEGIDPDQQHRDLIKEYREDPDRVRANTNLMRPWEIEEKVLARAPEEKEEEPSENEEDFMMQSFVIVEAQDLIESDFDTINFRSPAKSVSSANFPGQPFF